MHILQHDTSKPITGIWTTIDPFLTDLEMKALLHFTDNVISEDIAGIILITQTQRQQYML